MLETFNSVLQGTLGLAQIYEKFMNNNQFFEKNWFKSA